MKLSDKHWALFRIDSLFKMSTGANIAKDNLPQGRIPRITASSSNNGIDGFSGEAKTNWRTNINCVSIAFLGNCFYQPMLASYDMKIHSIVPINGEFNRYIALFIVQMCNREFKKFSYGNQLASGDLPRQKILLPVDNSGNPDYAFMEAYMKELEQKLLKKYADYQKNNWGGQILNKPCGWKCFNVSDKNNGLFHIVATKSGIDRNKLVNTGNGHFPYITRTDMNNGWDGFIALQPSAPFDVKNVITLGLDTQTAFYQPISFYTGQNIQVLSGPQINKHIALYVIQMIKLQMRSKFNWGGNGATLGRLHKMKIMLPVRQDGTPDYEYMEAYMKNIEANQIRKYLDFKSIV